MTREELTAFFSGLGLDLENPEFYNDQRFVDAERRNSEILWDYEEYVIKRAYSTEYESRARSAISRIIQYLFDELVRDGRLGACADASLVAWKLLEQYGFWNVIQTGSFTIDVPDAPTRQTRHCQSS